MGLVMSALLLEADIWTSVQHVRFGLQADIPVFSPGVAQGCKLAVMT
jgi:hypothetical protein